MTRSRSMGRTAMSGAVVSGAAQAIKIAASLLSTVIVARILSPADYGVIAMAAPVTAFVMLFQSLGLNQAIVQAKTISQSELNALFWTTMGASLVIVLIILALAPLASLFYGDERVGYIVAASSIVVLFTGLSLQQDALLARAMRFKATSAADIVGTVAGLAATIGAALLLRSYWALWIGMLVTAAARTAALWITQPWRPSLPISTRGSLVHLRFGSGITGFNLVNFVSRNLDTVLIAKVWGAASAGLYDRAYRLMMFPLSNINAPLGRIMLPILGRLRDEPERFRRAYLTALGAIHLLSLPGVLVAAIYSEQLVPFLLGNRWADAGPIFFWLAFGALLQPIGNTTGWLFIASGRTGALLKWGIFSAIVTIIALSIGVNWGAVGVAQGVFLSTLGRLPILFIWCTRGTPLSPRDFYRALLPNVVAGILTAGFALLLGDSMPFLALLGATLVFSYASNLGAQWTMPEGRRMITDLWTAARNAGARIFARLRRGDAMD